MRRRRKAEEDDHPDRWVISYADFITLLFAFFTTLYAISHVDGGKMAMFAGSMRSAFHSGGGGAAPIIEGIRPVPPDVVGIEKEVRQAMDTLKAGKEIELRKDDRGLVVAIGGDMLFETGRYRLRGAAVPVLDAIATVLRRLPNRVVIEGHTDNVPVAGGLEKYSSNWELSTARAMSVLNYLIKKHVLVPARFSASGYAEFKPVASNETPEGRTKNRRVDVVIVSARP